MKVVVSIVNYNTLELTKNCLESILQKNWKNNLEIWLVDNASKDGSAPFFKNNFPQIHLIVNKENMGFGRAHNLVFQKAKGDFFLVLNSDTLIGDGAIDEMVSFVQENECDLASCKILGFEGKLQPNGGDLPMGMALFSWLFNLEILGAKKNFHRNEKSYYEMSREVGWISGNFILISQKALKKLRGFDENYFMYFEDTEICFRAKKAGLKIMINPGVSIKHLSGGSWESPRLNQWRGELKGLLIFYKGAFVLRLLIYLSTLLRVISFALIGKFKLSLTYARIIASI